MKKYIVIILVGFLFIGCKKSIVKTNIPQSSYNINESKEKKVFLASYKPISNFLKFSDTIVIEEIWLEYLWYYTDINRNISKETEINGFVKFKDENLDVYDFELSYGSGFRKKGGISGNKLTFGIDWIPDNLKIAIAYKKDTILIDSKRVDN